MKSLLRFLKTAIVGSLLLASPYLASPFVAGVLFSACKSKPAPKLEELPSLTLVLKGIEADDPEHLTLLFHLEAEEPKGGHAKIESWQVEMEGQKAASAFTLEYPQGNFSLSSPVTLKLNMDVAALAAKGLAPRDDYSLTLITELDYSRDSAAPSKVEVRGPACFPGVQPPRFEITAIAILKAELINTRFRVSLKIDNPNPFPLELSSFAFKLYGNGRLWADGADRNILRVNSRSSLTGDLYLIMNFIDMDRNLLDQIIRLEDVNYRFTGDVEVSTGIDYLPKFNDGFDLSGYSEVLER